jgi:hypothetical protein
MIMAGVLVVIKPNNSVKTTPLTEAPSLDELQEIVGGSIEQVPGFLTIDRDGATHACVAFCNEDGKQQGLMANAIATECWERSLNRSGLSLYNRDDTLSDYLAGNVAVLYGDAAFIQSL